MSVDIDWGQQLPLDYDPDIPTHSDINSREGAAAARRSMPARRRTLCLTIALRPGLYSCFDFCEGSMRRLGHGGVSGTISELYHHGLVWRVGRKRNGRGRNEWTFALNPALVGHLHEIDWDMDLEDIQQEWSLAVRNLVRGTEEGAPDEEDE